MTKQINTILIKITGDRIYGEPANLKFESEGCSTEEIIELLQQAIDRLTKQEEGSKDADLQDGS